MRENPDYRPAATPDPVLCICGCEQPVKRAPHNYRTVPIAKGQPYNYRRGHGEQLNRDVSAALAARQQGNIPIEAFRSEVRKVAANMGGLYVVRDKVGIDKNSFDQVMYSRKRKTVSRAWATWFFRRLAGLPTEPTRAEQRRYRRRQAAIREIELETAASA